jgi:putative ATP-binding cassette transporter
MKQEQNHRGQVTWSRLVRAIRNLAKSEVGPQAKWMFARLVVFLVSINGLNVLSSYVSRDFMTAIADRRMDGFLAQGILLVGVFALSTLAAVFYRYNEESLGLLWRGWLTQRLFTFYLDHRIYFHIDTTGAVANPDQRIAEDVRSFTVTTLSFVLMLLNGSFTVMAFSGVLWSISPLLFLIAILYAIFGSAVTVFLGKTLVELNYDQLDKEADFRADLIHVRENAESVALLHREGRMRARLGRHLDALVSNFRRIIVINRNLGFFTTGYNYLIQVIPVLVVAPFYIRGEMEFGVIAQASMAFTMLLGAFSLIVTQFQSISNYAAVGGRLSALAEAIEEVAPEGVKAEVGESCSICLTPEEARMERAAGLGIHLEDNGEVLRFEHLTLTSPTGGEVLVKDLTLDIEQGRRVLLKGPTETAKLALFRAIAGMWDWGQGKIVRPNLQSVLFLPERPYLPPGTLRELLLHSGQEASVSDQEIIECLRQLGVADILERVGGLDQERDWDDLLSLSEQQSLAFARILLSGARFAVLDRPGTALSLERVRVALGTLAQRSMTVFTLGDGEDVIDDYDVLVELDAQGVRVA